MSDKIKLRLTIDVEYDLARSSQEEVTRQLIKAADFLADRGFMTGDLEADVESWESSVVQLKT